jgi:DNA-directed RNA polymerase subunit F
MSKPDVVEEVPLNIIEVKEMLKKIKKRDEQPNFRAQKTDEYLQAVNTIKPKEAKELKEKLVALNTPRIKEQHMQKLIDVMPTLPESVKTVTNGFNISLTADQVKKIATVIKEFAPKRKEKEE